MKQLSRRTAVRILAAGGGLLGLGLAGGYALRDLLGPAHRPASTATGSSSGRQAPMMGNATAADMSTYMDLFRRHTELHRRVELIPGGVRTVTEANDPGLAAQLQAHVASMYAHLNQGAEVSCMSSSLPVLFRNSRRYRPRSPPPPGAWPSWKPPGIRASPPPSGRMRPRSPGSSTTACRPRWP